MALGTRMAAFRQAPSVGRRLRKPQHPFQIRHQPYVIQPFLLAPVLPGETMKNLLMQARAVSDPVKNPLVGWWLEYYFFYVKHRDLTERDTFTEMMLDINLDTSATQDASASVPYYFFGGTMNWSKKCLQRVVEEYFRNPGEEWDDYEIDGMPIAMARNNGHDWLDSVVRSSELSAPNQDVDLNNDGTITVGEVNAAMESWKMLVGAGFTTQTYEEWLATYGVRAPEVEENRPELIRFLKEWSYPTNTVDPTNGTPSSALSWSIAERADKDRYFKEPGFVFGVSILRPKVYLARQIGSAAGLMNSALTWLPAIMRDDPWTSMLQVPSSTADGGTSYDLEGPLTGNATVANGGEAAGYWVDLKDLLLYGDQFMNFTPASTGDGNTVALPTAGMQKRYCSAADVDALFKTTAVNKLKQDGIVSLQILGTQVDTSVSM